MKIPKPIDNVRGARGLYNNRKWLQFTEGILNESYKNGTNEHRILQMHFICICKSIVIEMLGINLLQRISLIRVFEGIIYQTLQEEMNFVYVHDINALYE